MYSGILEQLEGHDSPSRFMRVEVISKASAMGAQNK